MLPYEYRIPPEQFRPFRPRSNETCGFLVARGRKLVAVWKVSNQRQSPTAFQIAERHWGWAYGRARRTRAHIVGVVHTHLFPDHITPSEPDWDAARSDPKLIFAIWNVPRNVLTFYNHTGILDARPLFVP